MLGGAKAGVGTGAVAGAGGTVETAGRGAGPVGVAAAEGDDEGVERIGGGDGGAATAAELGAIVPATAIAAQAAAWNRR